MTDPMPQSITRSDIITVATLSFSTGLMLMTAAISVAKGDQLAWLFACAAMCAVGSAFVVTRRTLRKIH
jgi:hypothetical protein